ncbi:hypothetical protein SAMN05661010_00569 [Modicisalibacter muralis]|uniref:ABC-type transport auxiliary lipoprotein component domain-containing protein n=1 Tax=Modicisalibacter muralis TaxID=119000 RepID=A0A1G9G0Z0_9GAMM|nr:ABC-type transport auxiliary lipoprotein family protein [Halomonas muralis]SDK94320.1 hypothetical protein SAMN05661010_00569 [Halomonas muralis]
MRPTRLLFPLLLLLWLAGCAGSPSSTLRYTLPSPPVSEESVAASHTLVLDSLELASFLDSEGIVLQRSDILLHQANSHLWAEDLERQLTRGLRQRLTNRLPDTRVLGTASNADALSLRVEVDQFQGRYDGMAVAGGRWQLHSVDGELLAFEPFQATVALESDGYPALVRALGRSWDQVADAMAERIEALR